MSSTSVRAGRRASTAATFLTRFGSPRTWLAQHDVAESVTVAKAALEPAAPMSSTIGSHRLLRLGGELNVRYPDNVHVISLRE